MGKYTNQILTHPGLKKYQIIVQYLTTVLFGTPQEHTVALRHRLIKSGVFYYAPFATGKTATISLLPYSQPMVRHSIWQLKFKNQYRYGYFYGELLSDTLPELLQELDDTYNFDDPVLCVVPSSKKTVRERGYCTNKLIAQAAVRQGLSYWTEYRPNTIIKSVSNERQSRIKKRSQRLTNPVGVFTVKKPIHVKKRNVVVLDDVYTTGATINEISKLLFQSGARRVLRVTIAH